MNGLEIVEPDEQPEKVALDDIRKVIKSWKITKRIPTEGPRSKAWDQVNFARAAKSAKALIGMFGDWKKAVECIEFVQGRLSERNLDCSLETVVKKADDFFEELAKRGEE